MTGIKSRVLLVEDNEPLLLAQTRLLARAGFAVEACSDAVRALALSREQSFDVILTDISMPNVTGLQLLRSVRQHNQDLPVVLMTGEPDIKSAAEAISHGALSYLLKPVAREELIETLNRAVHLYRLGLAKRQALHALGNHAGEGGDRAGLEASFERALASLWMAFQPIVRANDRSLYGYEALLRTNEPSLPHPGAVLDAAERLGRLHDLGRIVRQRSLSAFAGADRSWSLFLNLHPGDLLDEQLFVFLEVETNLKSHLVLELTERHSLDRIGDARDRIALLRAAGCRIAIDDLGAGYAGLSSFVQLQPDLVKLDMTLIRDLDKDPLKQRLVTSLTSVCQDMNLSIVAEGIETAAERDIAIKLGCDLLQGYRFGKPARPFVQPEW